MTAKEDGTRYKFINRDEAQLWIDAGWVIDTEDVFSTNEIIVVIWPDAMSEPKEPPK